MIEILKEQIGKELEESYMLDAMEKFGGSFVVALSGAIRRADHINYAKLEGAFPEYFEEYMEMGKKLKQKENK